MRQPLARLGDPVATVATPALVIDLDAMERNLAAMAEFARSRGIRLRPHAKMHKSAAIAKAQIAAGAVGVCTQKVSEAEVLADAGIADIYISNEVIDAAKLARVAELAVRIKLAIAVDSILGVDRLAEACKSAGGAPNVFVEIDVGQGRCGVSPAAAGAPTRARPSTDGARQSASPHRAARPHWCARRRRASPPPASRAHS